jgi:chromosome segregation ATPase
MNTTTSAALPQGMRMSEQTGFFTRIGNWFRRSQVTDGNGINSGHGPDSDSGDDSSSSHAMFGGPIEPRGTFLRPWARRDAAIENLQHGLGALAELMNSIRDNMDKQSARQDELLKILSHLPEALQQIPEASRMQTEALRAISQQFERQNEQQSKVAEILERMNQSDRDRGRTLDALQDRVETINQHDEKISEHLNSFGSVMETVTRNSQASTEVLEQLRENLGSRDGELQRVMNRQNTRFTSMLAISIVLAVSALTAVVIIGYEMISRGR